MRGGLLDHHFAFTIILLLARIRTEHQALVDISQHHVPSSGFQVSHQPHVHVFLWHNEGHGLQAGPTFVRPYLSCVVAAASDRTIPILKIRMMITMVIQE